MHLQPDFERCLHFINSQTWNSAQHPSCETNGSALLAVTISRQSGSGAHAVADCLADYLRQNSMPYEKAARLIGEAALEHLKTHSPLLISR